MKVRFRALPVLASLLAFGTVSPAAAQAPNDGVEHPEMFAERRAELLRRVESGVAVFHAKPVANRNDDVDYPYRQDSNFHYLTGFPEPEAVAVLSTGPTPAYTLFVRPRNNDPFDAEGEIWAGKRYGTEGAIEVFKADAAYPIDSLPAVMPRLLKGADRVFYGSGGDTEFGPRLREWALAAGLAATTGPDAENSGFSDADTLVWEMRVILSPEEIARVKRAVDITELAHRASMRAAHPGMWEYELEALQNYLYRVNGAKRFGFPSIVGSGPNSVTLHYEENDRQMQDGEVMVMDIGAEYAMYTADVTRTIPVNGKFTPEQAAVYQIIVDAQDAAMKVMRPGHNIGEANAIAAQVVTAGLIELGLLKGTVEENLQSGAFQRYYMHSLSHWIGLDVHDPGSYQEPDGSPRKFQPGMVLSNEPGIYIREGPDVPRKYWNVGVRIENDVLVTDGDPVDLTANIPRTIADVEAEMAKPAETIDPGAPRPPLPSVQPWRLGAGPAPTPRGEDDVAAQPRIAPPGQGKPKGEAPR